MGHLSGEDRSQLLLLPDAVDDYVGPDHPVRFIDAFVDSLDLKEAGFQRVQPNDKGRPGYDPADLLKLYIYGYLNRVRSSRRLEVETHRNLEVIWLLRQLRPDFKTIADFRRDNRSAFRQVFREFVRLCRALDLSGRELIAVDGTRIKAVNNRDRNFTRAKLKRDLQRIDDQLERYLEQMNEADANEASGGGNSVADLQDKIASIRKRKETLEGHRQKLDETGEAQLSLTDPDSRSMHSGTRVGVGYNVQLAVDSKHNLIAEQQVHSKVSDLGLLAETATAARQNLAVDEIDAVADGGYYKIEDIEDCEAGGITPFVPKPDRSPARSSGHFTKSEFQYDAATDTYRCPAGQRLVPLYRNRAGKTRDGIWVISYVNRAACRSCDRRDRCTKGTHRRLGRYENEATMDRMADRLAARPEVMDRRRESVEHPLGSIKQWMGQGAFLTRRLDNVRGEFSLTALAYNMRRAINGADLCRMCNAAMHGRGTPRHLSTDHDPLFEAHRWTANLRILEIDEIKTVPHVPRSHPFVEHLIGTTRRECLDHVLFWNARDLERKLADFQAYYNEVRSHASLKGHTPSTFAGGQMVARAELNNVRWVSHCRDLVQLPVAG